MNIKTFLPHSIGWYNPPSKKREKNVRFKDIQ